MLLLSNKIFLHPIDNFFQKKKNYKEYMGIKSSKTEENKENKFEENKKNHNDQSFSSESEIFYQEMNNFEFLENFDDDEFESEDQEGPRNFNYKKTLFNNNNNYIVENHKLTNLKICNKLKYLNSNDLENTISLLKAKNIHIYKCLFSQFNSKNNNENKLSESDEWFNLFHKISADHDSSITNEDVQFMDNHNEKYSKEKENVKSMGKVLNLSRFKMEKELKTDSTLILDNNINNQKIIKIKNNNNYVDNYFHLFLQNYHNSEPNCKNFPQVNEQEETKKYLIERCDNLKTQRTSQSKIYITTDIKDELANNEISIDKDNFTSKKKAPVNSIFNLIKQENLTINKNICLAFKNTLKGKRKLSFFELCRKENFGKTKPRESQLIKISEKINNEIKLEGYNLKENKIKNIHNFYTNNKFRLTEFLTALNTHERERELKSSLTHNHCQKLFNNKNQVTLDEFLEEEKLNHKYNSRLSLINSKLELSALNRNREINLIDEINTKLNIFSVIDIKKLKEREKLNLRKIL